MLKRKVAANLYIHIYVYSANYDGDFMWRYAMLAMWRFALL